MAELFSQVLGLQEKDVFLETPLNDSRYFSVTGLPSILSYGKHPFSITFNDPTQGPLLKNLSNIIFEFVDSRGSVIFTNLMDIEELSGAGNGFVWIKKDLKRTAGEVADGPAYFYVMGELNGPEIPDDWKGIYNVRSTFEYDIRKDFPNTSPIILTNATDIQTNFTISESVEFDSNDSVFKRSFINVSLTNLETNGGVVDSVELSYNEVSASTDDFDIITTYPLTSGSFETDSQTLTSGLNPITNTTKIPLPKKFRRNTPVNFRLRFLSPAKQLAQYLDENRQGEIVEVTSSAITFEGAPFFLERKDNLLKGRMNIGNRSNSGFKMSGENSAMFATVDYLGFKTGSGFGNNPGTGQGSGFMLYSGSVLVGEDAEGNAVETGDSYSGVGLELVGHSESFLRFRTDPALLEVKTDTFFFGSDTQFISGSSGNIEISSSNFHLDNQGNVDMAGTITATSGEIGGFTISANALSSDNFFISGGASGNDGTDDTNLFISSSGFAVTAEGDVTASALSLTGGDVGGLIVEDEELKVGSDLLLKATGQITGSKVLFSGGKIGAFEVKQASNPFTAGTEDVFTAQTGQFSSASLFATAAPLFEFKAGVAACLLYTSDAADE